MMSNQPGIFKDSKVQSQKARFSEWGIIGHEAQIDYLKSNISQDDLAHAYLFSGEEQIGKKKVTFSFIKALLCNSNSKPCEKCASCLQISKAIHPDVALLLGTESVKIEEIRKLISKISLKPFNSSYKVAVIDNAERLTPEAANALLKTLEEPPGQAVLVLITKDQSNLLPTIVSRLRIIKFFRAPTRLIMQILHNKKITLKKQDLISITASGKPGRTFELLENPDEVQELEAWLKEFFVLLNQGRAEKLNYASKLAKLYSADPDKALKIITFWITILRDIVNYKNISHYKSLVVRYVKPKDLERLDISALIYLIKYTSAMREIISNPSSGFNIKLVFDLLVLSLDKVRIS